ncbi:hypothetical protein EJ03DRAFT_326262 [Teratosphaeria nubilosa]|uniref:Glycosyltransferase family 25 protein n=1 Tax=Teratosphaeria nubilosa TaxID=161662 RepID=A0A6G1LDI3_9PEZI|nr:hypothetical protein EJ03DRAFT_326262 [Teratosphaeria nubilosa]
MLAHRNSRSPLGYVLVALAVLVFFFYHRNIVATHVTSTLRSTKISGASRAQLAPANSTLGFGGLYVVSGPGSPRRQHLEEAAAVTELNFTIPTQIAWTDEDVRNFRPEHEEESNILTGSIKAWMSHHVVLNEFLDSGLETALIFEDDVDWDIRLRTKQVPLAQQAVRNMSNSEAMFDEDAYPWGPNCDWDLLYIGHCGDFFGEAQQSVGVGHHHPEQLQDTPFVLYEDPTMQWRTDLHPFTASLLTAFRIPEQTRVVHKSQWPLCTFGYAVTREAAKQIIEEIAPAHEDPSRNLAAYDAAILTGCRDGPLKCLTVTPELFHHMEGESLIADEEQGEREVFRPPVDKAGLEQVKYRKETSNIGCGFWDGSFYYGDDADRLEFLLEEVGRKGQCLKPGRDPKTGLPV